MGGGGCSEANGKWENGFFYLSVAGILCALPQIWPCRPFSLDTSMAGTELRITLILTAAIL